MGTLNPDIVDALNMLLEDERASVEIEVALANGATEYLEREALTSMGVEDTLASFLLRDWLESHHLPVTRRINGIVLQALDLTRYDDRLLLFLQHQNTSREQAEQLLADAENEDSEDSEDSDDGDEYENGYALDDEVRAILRSIVDAHTRHAVWCEQRAREFAETRQFEFRRPAERPLDRPHDAVPGSVSGSAEGGSPPDSPDLTPSPSPIGRGEPASAPHQAEHGVEDAVNDATDEPESTSAEAE